MTQADALAILKDRVSADAYPTLADPFLTDLLDRNQLYRLWEAEVDVEVGERFAPTVKNGRVYICVQGGLTGETEPEWPTRAQSVLGLQIEDNEVIWEDAGRVPKEMWDLDNAAFDGWMKKAGDVAGRVNQSDSGQSASRSDLITHCLTMAAGYSKGGVIG